MAKDDVTAIHSTHRTNRPDRHHEQQLLRDLQAINAATAQALGPLPLGGLPVQPKRKPRLPLPAVPPATPPPSPSDEDTPMQWKNAAAVAALATGTALAACGAVDETSTSANPSPAAASGAPESVEMPPVKAVPQPVEDAEIEHETATEQTASEPERGPAIPAAQLRQQILELLGSFQTLKDLERENVEHRMQVALVKHPNMDDGHEYFGATTEGWGYRLSVERLGRMEDPPTVKLYLNNGVKPWTNEQTTYCTLEFESLARELVAMGYEKDSRAYPAGRDISWGFGKSSADQNFGVGVEVLIYDIQTDKGRKMTCIEGFRISGGVLGG